MDSTIVYLSTKEAADELDLGPDRIRQLERQGMIPALRTRGGTRLFLLSDVLAFKEHRKAKHAEAAR